MCVHACHRSCQARQCLRFISCPRNFILQNTQFWSSRTGVRWAARGTWKSTIQQLRRRQNLFTKFRLKLGMAQEKLSRRPVWMFTFCDATCTLNISSTKYKFSLNRVAHYCNFQWQLGEPPVLGPRQREICSFNFLGR